MARSAQACRFPSCCLIGGGPAGYPAALRAAQLGLTVACIDDWKNDEGQRVLQEHLGGEHTIALLGGIGVGEGVHEIDGERMRQADAAPRTYECMGIHCAEHCGAAHRVRPAIVVHTAPAARPRRARRAPASCSVRSHAPDVRR